MDAQSANSQDNLGGPNLAAQLKKLKGELRVSKKAEQIAKEKLVTTKKQLEKLQQEHQRQKEESEVRVSALRQENNMLKQQVEKALAQSAELQELHSHNSPTLDKQQTTEGEDSSTGGNRDALKLVEEYSRQIELKSKELESLNVKFAEKKVKMTTLKKERKELANKLQRVESKLENMSKFSHIFIKSIKQQNLSLRSQVEKQKQDFDETFNSTCKVIQQQIAVRFKKEHEQTAKLKEQLTSVERSQQEAVTGKSAEQQSQMQTSLERIQAKHDKQKSKVITLSESLKNLTQQHDKLKVQYETEKTKNEITLVEREKENNALRNSLEKQIAKEQDMIEKADKQEQKHREEHKRLVEMYEGSGRYKDVRDLYESNLAAKDTELMSVKEQLMQAKMLSEQREKESIQIQQKADQNAQKYAQDAQTEKEVQSSKIHDLEKQIAQIEQSLNEKVLAHASEIESLQSGIAEQLEKSMADMQSQQKTDAQKHTEEKENLETKIRELERSLAAKAREIELRDANISEVEKELEQKQEKVIELTQQQIERIKKLQQVHQDDLQSLETKYKNQIDEMQKEHLRELVTIEKSTTEAQKEVVEVIKEAPKPETINQGTQTEPIEEDKPAPPVERIMHSEEKSEDESLSNKEPELASGDYNGAIETIELHEITSQETTYGPDEQEGDVSEKIAEPRKEWKKDMAIRGPRPVMGAGRGMSQGRGGARPMGMAPRPMGMAPRPSMNVQRAPRMNRPVRPSTSVPARQVHSSPFGGMVAQPEEDTAQSPSLEETKEPVAPITQEESKGSRLHDLAAREREDSGGFDNLVAAKSSESVERKHEDTNEDAKEPKEEQEESDEPKQANTYQQQQEEEPAKEEEKEPPTAQVDPPEETQEEPAPVIGSSQPSQPRKPQKLLGFSDDEGDDDDNNKPESEQQTASKSSSAPKTPPKAAPLPMLGAQQPQAGSNRLMNMISSLFSLVKRTPARKPERAMRWDPVKRCYFFDGESDTDESDGGGVARAPPSAEELQRKKKEAEEKKLVEEQKTVVEGVNAFTQVAFSGARINRRKEGPVNRTPNRPTMKFGSAAAQPSAQDAPNTNQTSNDSKPPEEETKEPVSHEIIQEPNEFPKNIKSVDDSNELITDNVATRESTEAFNKSIDPNRSMYHSAHSRTVELDNSTISQQQPSLTNSTLLNNSMQYLEMKQEFKEHEQHWTNMLKKKDSVITKLRAQISQVQKQLQQEKDTFQQTFESLRQVVGQLQFEGESQSREIQSLKDKVLKQNEQDSINKFRQEQRQEIIKELEEEIEELQKAEKELRKRLVEAEIEVQVAKIDQRSAEESHKEMMSTSSPEKRRALEERIYELESELEELKWKITAVEIQKIELLNANAVAQHEAMQSQQQLQAVQKSYDEMREDQNKQIQEAQAKSQEKLIQTEKERDNLREHVSKLQAEKQRLSDQVGERRAEFEKQLRHIEQEKQKSQEEFKKLLREKEQHFNTKISELTAERQAKVQELEEKMQDQATEMQKQVQKRQRENQNNEKQARMQLDSLQGILRGKDETLNSLQSANEEFTNELAQHSEMRDKLNEHIIYLQNEVRKRDQLLESGSEFGGDEDFAVDSDTASVPDESSSTRNVGDSSTSNKAQKTTTVPTTAAKKPRTMGAILKAQLDETRQTLKSSIEARLRSEKQVQNTEQKYSKIVEGVKEISALIDQQLTSLQTSGGSYADEDDQSQSSESFDSVIHTIISKIFKLQHSNESRAMELQHEKNIGRLKADEASNIKFDLEILTQEKQWLDQENDSLITQIQNLKEQLQNQEIRTNEQLNAQKKDLEDIHQRAISELAESLRQEQSSHADQREAAQKASQVQRQFADEISAKDSEIRNMQQKCEKLQVDNDRVSEELSETQMHKDQLQNKLITAESKIQDANVDLGEVRAQLQEANHLKSRVQQTAIDKDQELKQLRQSLTLEQEQVSQLNAKVAESEDFIERLSQGLRDKKQQYKNQLKARVEKMIEEINLIQAKSDELIAQNNEKHSASLASLQEANQKLEAELAAKNEDCKRAVQEQSNVSMSQDQIISNIRAEYSNEILELKTQLEKSESALKNKDEKFVADTRNLDEMQSQNDQKLQQMQQELNTAISDRETQTQTIESLTNELNELRINTSSSVAQLTEELRIAKDTPDSITEKDRQAIQSAVAEKIAKLKEKNEKKVSQLRNGILELNEHLKQSNEENTNLRIQLETSQKNLEDAHDQIRQRDLDKTQSIAEVEELRSNYQDTQRDANEKKDATISDLQEQMSKYKEEQARKEAEIEQQHEEIQRVIIELKNKKNTQKADYKAILKKIQEENINLSKQVEAAQSALAEQTQAKELLNSEIADNNAKKDEEIVNNLKLQLQQRQDQVTDLEAKLAELEDQVAEQDRESKVLEESMKEADDSKDDQLARVKDELESAKQELESQKQSLEEEFMKILKEKKAAWKIQNTKIKDDFKGLVEEYEQLQREFEQLQNDKKLQNDETEETASLKAQVEELKSKLESIGSEKTELIESLDLTRVQFKDEMSKFEGEQVLMSEFVDKIKDQAIQLVNLMKEMGVEIEDTVMETSEDFSKLIQACRVAFQNYSETKAAFQQLIDERDDVAREKEDMGFELERANAELNFIKNQFAKSDVGKLERQVANLSEESQEMKNDFIIKFASYTEQIETLKSKLSAYESQDDTLDDDAAVLNPSAMETSRDYRAKYNIDDTINASLSQEDKDPKLAPSAPSRGGFGGFMASLFLTESEMAGKQNID